MSMANGDGWNGSSAGFVANITRCVMSKNLSHDEAIAALCGCAASVTVLSYQEAIEGYFSLRGLPIPAPQEPDNDAVERRNPCDGIFDHKWLSPSCVADGCRSLNTRTLLEAVEGMQPPSDPHTNSWLTGFARARKMAADLVRSKLDPAIARNHLTGKE